MKIRLLCMIALGASILVIDDEKIGFLVACGFIILIASFVLEPRD